MRRASVVAAALAVGVTVVAGWSQAPGTRARHPVDGGPALTLIAALRPGVGPAVLGGALSRRSLSGPLNAWAVTVPRADSERLLSVWRRTPDVLAIQRDRLIAAAAEDTSCSGAPGSSNVDLLKDVGDDQVQPPSSTRPIAILDSGIDQRLPEFAGRIRDPANVINGSADVSDSDGHGTAVAGMAASSATLVRGISPTSPIIPIKVLRSDGSTTAADLIAGIGRAVADGAGVINISAASPLAGIPALDNRVVQMAIDQAVSRNAIVVTASGNEGSAAPDVPAVYPHLLSVGATSLSDRHALCSNTGRTVDLSAPGVEVTEPAPTAVCPSGFQTVSGTSFAAPAVAGAAALVGQQRPGLRSAQLSYLLARGARQVTGSGWSPLTGFGVLNVAAALAAPAPPPMSSEVDDDIYWLTGSRAAGKSPAIGKARGKRAVVRGLLDTLRNPADVFRVKLRRGERVALSVAAAPGGRLQAEIWDPRAGPFSVRDQPRRHLVAARTASGGFSLHAVATRAGTYFVSLRSRSNPPGGSAYSLAIGLG